jgi:hypothetical protein
VTEDPIDVPTEPSLSNYDDAFHRRMASREAPTPNQFRRATKILTDVYSDPVKGYPLPLLLMAKHLADTCALGRSDARLASTILCMMGKAVSEIYVARVKPIDDAIESGDIETLDRVTTDVFKSWEKELEEGLAKAQELAAETDLFESAARCSKPLGTAAVAAGQKKICSRCGIKESPCNPLSRCNKCKRALYCGKDCQTKDWELHKRYCEGKKTKVSK